LTIGRIQRSLERKPDSFSGKPSSPCPQARSLMVDGVAENSVSPDQSKYVNSLEIRLKSSEADVKSKQADLIALQTKLDKQVTSFWIQH
jgi:hypothetical protein